MEVRNASPTSSLSSFATSPTLLGTAQPPARHKQKSCRPAGRSVSQVEIRVVRLSTDEPERQSNRRLCLAIVSFSVTKTISYLEKPSHSLPRTQVLCFGTSNRPRASVLLSIGLMSMRKRALCSIRSSGRKNSKYSEKNRVYLNSVLLLCYFSHPSSSCSLHSISPSAK